MKQVVYMRICRHSDVPLVVYRDDENNYEWGIRKDEIEIGI
jgi:hypothetical protein